MTTIGTRAPEAVLTGPVAWQRTGVIGTELVVPGPDHVSGTVVVAGREPYALDWRAGLDDDAGVVDLVVGCKGAGWTRTLEMRRTGGSWVTHPDLDAEASVLVDGSPIFLSWAMRGLGTEPVRRPVIRVAVPSLEISTTMVTFHRISESRLRVTGGGPAVTYELDRSGMVSARAGQFRRAL
ncbi:putative glycolipid-binding domain-containing protein [Actinoplanes sp. NPDC023714]|uniref:putative glycolipid-binding domain-containing protein n=1 Tax=Actinoplanes sp. NPDC023714 TaxID=3154322 RepID=UPI0033F74C68